MAFANNTHNTIARAFGAESAHLTAVLRTVGGRVLPSIPGFDLVAAFGALPKVPLFLRFNAADTLLPAEVALLFQADTPRFLGPRSLFAVATYLTGRLISA